MNATQWLRQKLGSAEMLRADETITFVFSVAEVVKTFDVRRYMAESLDDFRYQGWRTLFIFEP